MSKLTYPVDGVYPLCKGDFGTCNRNLAIAISNCNFDIPSDFPYRSYLYGLQDVLRGYYNEVGNIDNNIRNTDASFKNLSSRLAISAGKITTSKITKRDRMVV